MAGASSIGFAVLAVIGGVAIAAQQLTNYGLRVGLGSILWAGFFSYLGGTLSMAAALVLTRTGWPGSAALSRVEPISWIGGALGALYIAISILALPRLGVALLIALIVVGQMLASLAFDQFALLGTPQHSISLMRIIGALALVGGVALIKAG
jgi:transporter family-2 protein